MRKIFDLFALVRVGMVFLCLFFSLECLFAQEQNRVFMHYDSMTICRGDSFPLHTFLKNEVEVPIGFELLGWQNLTGEFFKPEGDTTLFLLYRKKGDLEVRSLTFHLSIRELPFVELAVAKKTVCHGVELEEIPVRSENCDLLYWEDLQTGQKSNRLSDFDVTGKFEERRVFQVVGSNESCADVSTSRVEYIFKDPEKYRLAVNLPPDEVEVCADSLLLCEYVQPDLLKVYYENELLERRSAGSLPFEIIWLEKDSFSRCEKYAKSGYENFYWFETTVEDGPCGKKLELSEKHLLQLKCTASARNDFKLSASCQSGYWKIFWGVEYKVKSIEFKPLHEPVDVVPELSESEDYDFETFLFPYKGCAKLCWLDSYEDLLYQVMINCEKENGEEVVLSDTLHLTPCPRRPPLVFHECSKKEGKTMIHIGSEEPILSVAELESQFFLQKEDFEGNDRLNHYQYAQTHSFVWTENLPDTLVLKLKVSLQSCDQDTLETLCQVGLEKCLEMPRIFYGAYTSPHAILQQKEQCLQKQCYNIPNQSAKSVTVQSKCYGDTIYLKFKGLGINRNENYVLNINSSKGDDFQVYYPHDYKKTDSSVFHFNNVETMNPTLYFVPSDDCVVEGDLEGIFFRFHVDIIGERITREAVVCKGDSFDLGDIVEGDDSGLQWNVSNPKVSPLKDTEYYLYGFTESGCLVDERVLLRVSHPLWVQTTQDSFCEGEILELKDLIHTNATEVEWRWNGNEQVSSDVVEMGENHALELSLHSFCDSLTLHLPLNVVNCEQVESKPSLKEESWKNKLQIASYFTPDGDGIADEWRIEGEYSLLVCHIYDRFGKVLKSYENEPIVWDGRYKGAMQPPTDYWYLLYVEGDEKRIVGHFSLLR